MKIWLDDRLKPPIDGWIWFNNAYLVIDALKNLGGRITHLDLDHDLGDESVFGNGYMVTLWLEQQVFHNKEYIPPLVSIHTQNPVARDKMRASLTVVAREIWDRQTKQLNKTAAELERMRNHRNEFDPETPLHKKLYGQE